MSRRREGTDKRALEVQGARCGQPRGQARWGEGLGGRGREGWLGAERGSQKGSGSAGCEVCRNTKTQENTK